MGVRLHYFARPIHRRDGRLEGGEALHFLGALDAEEGGRLLSRMVDGVVVYQQMADPENDIWEEPEILAVHGVGEGVILAALQAA